MISKTVAETLCLHAIEHYDVNKLKRTIKINIVAAVTNEIRFEL